MTSTVNLNALNVINLLTSALRPMYLQLRTAYKNGGIRIGGVGTDLLREEDNCFLRCKHPAIHWWSRKGYM